MFIKPAIINGDISSSVGPNCVLQTEYSATMNPIMLWTLVTCSCTIIGPYHISTAAHCITNTPTRVSYGTINAADSQYSSLGKTAYIHTEYDPETLENDIAIIQVYNKLHPPYAIVANQSMFADPVSVYGYGIGGNNHLNYYDALVTNIAACFTSSNSVICTDDHLEDSSVVCSGDSGGGVYETHETEWNIMAVNSFTFNNCDSHTSGHAKLEQSFVNCAVVNINNTLCKQTNLPQPFALGINIVGAILLAIMIIAFLYIIYFLVFRLNCVTVYD